MMHLNEVLSIIDSRIDQHSAASEVNPTTEDYQRLTAWHQASATALESLRATLVEPTSSASSLRPMIAPDFSGEPTVWLPNAERSNLVAALCRSDIAPACRSLLWPLLEQLVADLATTTEEAST